MSALLIYWKLIQPFCILSIPTVHVQVFTTNQNVQIDACHGGQQNASDDTRYDRHLTTNGRPKICLVRDQPLEKYSAWECIGFKFKNVRVDFCVKNVKSPALLTHCRYIQFQKLPAKARYFVYRAAEKANQKRFSWNQSHWLKLALYFAYLLTVLVQTLKVCIDSGDYGERLSIQFIIINVVGLISHCFIIEPLRLEQVVNNKFR